MAQGIVKHVSFIIANWIQNGDDCLEARLDHLQDLIGLHPGMRTARREPTCPTDGSHVKLAKLVLQMPPWLLEFSTLRGKVASKQVGSVCDDLVAKWSARYW